jgi:hypothetical protein
MAIQAQESDPITWLDADFAESARKMAYALCQLRIREALASADDRCSARVLLLGVARESDGSERNVHGIFRLF